MDRIITLTTDFGLTDEYVGVMKGVILSVAPAVRIVDLTHGIGSQSIREAAYVVHSACDYFPPGTLHVVVVDPWVGTDRRIILVSVRGQMFLAPDNGVLTLFMQDRQIEFARQVDCQELYLQPVCHTFHGRDIFAPVAAHLARGMALEKVGPELDPQGLIVLPMPEVDFNRQRGEIRGSVVRVDHFGNLITNIHRRMFLQICPQGVDAPMQVNIKGQIIHGLASSYSAVENGSLLAIFSSRDYLEIALNMGSAARQLAAGDGQKVSILIQRRNLTLYK